MIGVAKNKWGERRWMMQVDARGRNDRRGKEQVGREAVDDASGCKREE